MQETQLDFVDENAASPSLPPSPVRKLQVGSLVVYYSDSHHQSYALYEGVNVVSRASATPDRASEREARWQQEYPNRATHGIFLDSNRISGSHALLVADAEGGISVTDLGSRNKTCLLRSAPATSAKWVELQPNQGQPARTGSLVKFSVLECRIDMSAAAAQAQPAASGQGARQAAAGSSPPPHAAAAAQVKPPPASGDSQGADGSSGQLTWSPPSPQRRAMSEILPAAWAPAPQGQASDSEPDGGSWSDSPFQPQPQRAWGPPTAPLAIPRSQDDSGLGLPGSLGERLPSLRDWAGSGSGGASSRYVYRQPSLNEWIPSGFLSRSSGATRQPAGSPIPEAEPGSPPRSFPRALPRQRSLRREGPPRSPKRSRSPPVARLSSGGGSFGSQHQPKAARLTRVADSAQAVHEAPEGLASGFRDFRIHAEPAPFQSQKV